jgi:PTH1 family peptidyl-tRNA hydrolase
MILDLLVKRHSLSWSEHSGRIMVARWRIKGREITLLKPLTFMNASGEALEDYGGIDPACFLVIFDDISLPLGHIRLRERGGSGGHRGLESIIAHFGTDDFARLRLGIGEPPPGSSWSDYVLAPFPEEEREAVSEMIETAADALETALARGLVEAMNRYNRKTTP